MVSSGGGSGSTDYYATLNVPRDASLKEIRHAYGRLSLAFHPDKQRRMKNKQKNDDGDKDDCDDCDDHAALLTKSAEQFVALERAYRVLSDENLRAAYDLYGDHWGSHDVTSRHNKPLTVKYGRNRDAAVLRHVLDQLMVEQRLEAMDKTITANGSTSITLSAKPLIDALINSSSPPSSSSSSSINSNSHSSSINKSSNDDDDDDDDNASKSIAAAGGSNAPKVKVTRTAIRQYVSSALTSKTKLTYGGYVLNSYGLGTGAATASLNHDLTDRTSVGLRVQQGSDSNDNMVSVGTNHTFSSSFGAGLTLESSGCDSLLLLPDSDSLRLSVSSWARSIPNGLTGTCTLGMGHDWYCALSLHHYFNQFRRTERGNPANDVVRDRVQAELVAEPSGLSIKASMVKNFSASSANLIDSIARRSNFRCSAKLTLPTFLEISFGFARMLSTVTGLAIFVKVGDEWFPNAHYYLFFFIPWFLFVYLSLVVMVCLPPLPFFLIVSKARGVLTPSPSHFTPLRSAKLKAFT